MNLNLFLTRIDKLIQVFGETTLLRAFVRHRVLAGAEHRRILTRELATVIDIGANRGQFSLAVRRWAPDARIIAFEPLSAAAARFREVFQGKDRVTLCQAAVGPEAGEAVIHVSAADDSSSLLSFSKLQEQIYPGTAEVGTEKILVGPLTDFISKEEIVFPALLKLDVQGYEQEALKGCEELLGLFSQVYVECSFVELYSGQSLAGEVIAWLKERGFGLTGIYNMAYDRSGRAVQGDFMFENTKTQVEESKSPIRMENARDRLSCFDGGLEDMTTRNCEQIRILGIDFFNGSAQQAVKKISEKGGYLVAPSGPGLATLPRDARYAEALAKSDIAIADSRYMALLWLLFQRQKVRRISGLTFLKAFFRMPDLKAPGTLFSVDPSAKEAVANRRFLASIGIPLDPEFSYVAPIYNGPVEDTALLEKLDQLRPRYVLLNIAGGIQEKLAQYLVEHLAYRPAIICTGAAIAFLSGEQASIPAWADHVGLGWLWRCLDEPRKFVPRFLSAFPLFMLVLRYRSRMPAST